MKRNCEENEWREAGSGGDIFAVISVWERRCFIQFRPEESEVRFLMK